MYVVQHYSPSIYTIQFYATCINFFFFFETATCIKFMYTNSENEVQRSNKEEASTSRVHFTFMLSGNSV